MLMGSCSVSKAQGNGGGKARRQRFRRDLCILQTQPSDAHADFITVDFSEDF